MHNLGGIVGGVAAGLIGAAVWAAVTYWGRVEIGWLAWGIGALVGFGVHVGSRRQGSVAAGGTAVIVAVVAVLLGKWAAVRVDVAAFLGGDLAPISVIADVIVSENEAAGRPMRMPDARRAKTLRVGQRRQLAQLILLGGRKGLKAALRFRPHAVGIHQRVTASAQISGG